MIFAETKLGGVFLIKPERIEDERGFFARTLCRQEFARIGLISSFAQSRISYNHARGTLRGMHYQASPHEETKLVRCTAGTVHDVVVDLRSGSETFLQWIAIELSAENRHAAYIPSGCAHGFLTLEDRCEVLYEITPSHEPASSRGYRWNDPAFGIRWPDEIRVISERDRTFPDFQP